MFHTKVVEKIQTHFMFHNILSESLVLYDSVSQPPGRGPVPGPGFNYTGPREVLLDFVILIF